MQQFLLMSLLVGGEKGEGFPSFCATHGHLFPSWWVIWEPDIIAMSRTKHVRYLLGSSRAINLCHVPCGYLGNTGAQPGRGALQTWRALASVPAFSVTVQQVIPTLSFETSTLSSAKGKMAPSQEALKRTEIHLPNVQRAKRYQLAKWLWQESGQLELGLAFYSWNWVLCACVYLCVRVRVCARVCARTHACSHTCMRVQSRKHLPKHLVMLSLDSRIKSGFPFVFYTFRSFPKAQFPLIIF